MKKALAILMMFLLCLPCAQAQTPWVGAVQILLSDSGVMVNGQPAPADPGAAVYTANDIVFYLAGQDFTYGEGEEDEGHTPEEASAHTVVHITQPGTYVLSGKLSAGQIAVDVQDGKKDPKAVVTLILNGVDITCSVAPAVIFYNVYECGNADAETASMTVDTSAAGANVIIADDTVNTITGSHVARIYQPGTVTLSADGKKVEDAGKLHKYDGAFYSKRSMNIGGQEKGNGVLNIYADNEGLGSELHLTIDGGCINIVSGNDGINTNEDNVSVTTVNGGHLNITVTGATGEGDGIDSNGWLVINGGSVTSAACAFSGDAGIDSDMGIWLNGGEVCATGNMFDRVAGGDEPYAVYSFTNSVRGGSTIALKNESGETVYEWTPANDFHYLIVSGQALQPGNYTLWQGETQLAHTGSAAFGFGGMKPPEMPEGMPEPPEGFEHGPMMPPEGFEMPEDFRRPEGLERPEKPEGMEPPTDDRRGFAGGRAGLRSGRFGDPQNGEQQTVFIITEDGGTYSGVEAVMEE